MSEVLKLLLSLSLSGSILALLIFAMKPFIKNRLSKSVQYYIWIVVLLRLVIPYSFEGSIMNNVFYGDNISGETNSQISVQPSNNAEEVIINSSVLPNVEENKTNGVYNADVDHSRYLNELIKQYTLYLWLLGVIVTFAVNIIGYIRFVKYLKQANRPTANEERSMIEELLKGRRNVRLVRNGFVTTPMLMGIIRPCIIIPDISFSEKQLKNILLHEIVHYKRVDIGVKWLAMIAASIHWFNPFIYFIKKEINHACELACDEAVIRNLSTAEKQAYGDTLISVVAQQKYPVGVLQATMCEEKKSLKERLLAIMNHNKKSKLIVIFSGVLLLTIIFGSLYLGAGVGFGKAAPPNLYISTEDSETKEAIIGTYSWSYNGTHIEADSDYPVNFKYKPENIISISGKQQLILGTQKIKADKKYDFTIGEIAVYKDGELVEFEAAEPSFMDGNLYLQSPTDAGEYIYHLVLNFKDRGTVNYGFVARVDMLTEEKITAFKGLELYAWRKPEMTGNDDIYFTLLPGTNRIKTKSEVYDLSVATTDLNLIKQELSKYSSGTYLFIMHSTDIDKVTMSNIGDTLSGVIENGVISIGGSELNEYLEDDQGV